MSFVDLDDEYISGIELLFADTNVDAYVHEGSMILTCQVCGWEWIVNTKGLDGKVVALPRFWWMCAKNPRHTTGEIGWRLFRNAFGVD